MTDIKEDGEAPANNAGAGAIAGLGTGAASQREPGVNKKKKLRDITITSSPLKRLVPNEFDRKNRFGN